MGLNPLESGFNMGAIGHCLRSTLMINPPILRAFTVTVMTQELSTKPQPLEAQLLPVPAASRTLSWRVASSLFTSFGYAWAGLSYAFQTQRNFRIHLGVGTVAIALSIFLQLTSVEIAIITLTCGLVLTMELLNTALESVVDLTVRQTYHELAKIAKDCAAGAVLISAMFAVLVGAFLMVPPLFTLLQPQVSLWISAL
jgi:diacylglycerol kinase (ATP)